MTHIVVCKVPPKKFGSNYVCAIPMVTIVPNDGKGNIRYLAKKAPSVTAISRILNQFLYSRGKKAKSRGCPRICHTLYYVSSSHISNRSNQKKLSSLHSPLVSPGMHPKDCDTRSRRDAFFIFFLAEPPLPTLKEQPLF